MKHITLSVIALFTLSSLLASCEEDTTMIGSAISTGEVVITVDSLIYELNARAVKIEDFDSKTGNLMIGHLQVENYGDLSCSFVTRLLPASNLEIADSIFNLEDFVERVDSCKLIMGAIRDEIVGDSLAPQKMSIYKLTRQLPAEINNTFNPEGYYNPSDPFATKSYTVSSIAQSDSAFYNNSFVELNVDLPVEFGREIFRTYKNNPSIFQWPQTMATEFLPGLYVKPTFGNGCVANIHTIFVGVFYHTYDILTTVEDDETKTSVYKVNNLSVPFTVSPEVLSSNNITYTPSENIILKNENLENTGEVVVTTPGGYIAEFKFPIKALIEKYQEHNSHLTTVNDLIMYIPGESFDANTRIGVAENMLLIKKTEYDEFFAKNKVPDNLTSFIGSYYSNVGKYYFNSMRSYFIDLLSKDEITEEDITFYIVPVEITTETSSSYYTSNTYVTKCELLTSKPTMTLLKTNESTIAFSFSTQMID